MVQGLPRGAGLRRSQGPGRPNRPRRAPLPRVPAPSPRRPRGSGRTSGLAATPRRATPARRPRAPLRRRGLGALRPGMGAARRRPNRSRSARPGPVPAPLTARSAPRPPPRPPPAAPHLATGADRTQAGEEAEWLPRRRLPGSRQPDSSGRAEAACGTRPPTAHARPRPRPAAGHRAAPRGPPRPAPFRVPGPRHPEARPAARPPPAHPGLTDVVVLDVLDEVGQRGEVESAAPEAAGVGEEGGGGDACHGATSRAPRSRLCER